MRSHYYKNKLTKKITGLLAATLLLGGFSTSSYADKMTIKVATVVPRGSVYHQALQEIGEKWKAAQGDGSRFIIYTDGSQGPEAAAVRRMRIGQIQASMLTVNGLLEIDDSVVALQLMPLIFRNWDEYDHVRDKIAGDLEKKFNDKGYHVLMWGEAGWVQFFSNKKRVTPEDFKDAKIFTLTGTKDQASIMKSIDYTPVVLSLADIAPSVQTGMVDVVPVAPMWALAGQFYSDVPHMLRMNWVPVMGATLIRMQTWKKMKPEARQAMSEAAVEAAKTLRAHREGLDQRAIDEMKERGLIVHEMTPELEKQWQAFIQPIWPKIRGSLVPADMFDRVQNILAEYRKNKK